jgi:hypothetical protein
MDILSKLRIQPAGEVDVIPPLIVSPVVVDSPRYIHAEGDAVAWH